MPIPKYDVLSYGTIGMDMILKVPHWPRPDKSTHTLAPALHLGGKATNTAVYLASWGKQVALSGTEIGYDDIGTLILDALKSHRLVSTEYLKRRSDMESMYCLILVDPHGERAIIGVNADSVTTTPPVEEMLSSAKILTLDLYGGQERIDAARVAHSLNMPVVIGDLRDPDHPVVPYTTIAIASKAELLAEHHEPVRFAMAVLEKGAKGIIVTDGSHTTLAFDGTSSWQVKPTSVQVTDTTGAGDAFRAGVIYGLLEGSSLAECCVLGTAAGSLAVTRYGACASPPDVSELVAATQSVRHTVVERHA